MSEISTSEVPYPPELSYGCPFLSIPSNKTIFLLGALMLSKSFIDTFSELLQNLSSSFFDEEKSSQKGKTISSNLWFV